MGGRRHLGQFGGAMESAKGFNQGFNDAVMVLHPEVFRQTVVYEGMPSALPQGVEAVKSGVEGVGVLLTAEDGVIDHCPPVQQDDREQRPLAA